MLSGKWSTALAIGITCSTAAHARPREPRVPCEHFRKLPNGDWRGEPHAVIDISGSRIDFSGTTVRPSSGSINGQDLYRLIETHCTRPRPTGDPS